MTHSLYLHELNNHPKPSQDDLRIEDISRPLMGDLIRRGMIIRTNYSGGAYGYIIDRITAFKAFNCHCWSLTGFHADRDGTFIKKETNRIFLNEYLVEYEGDTPRFRRLFRANKDELEIIGHGLVARKTGQFEMVL